MENFIENEKIHINPEYYDKECTKHLINDGFSEMTKEEIEETDGKAIFVFCQ